MTEINFEDLEELYYEVGVGKEEEYLLFDILAKLIAKRTNYR